MSQKKKTNEEKLSEFQQKYAVQTRTNEERDTSLTGTAYQDPMMEAFVQKYGAGASTMRKTAYEKPLMKTGQVGTPAPAAIQSNAYLAALDKARAQTKTMAQTPDRPRTGLGTDSGYTNAGKAQNMAESRATIMTPVNNAKQRILGTAKAGDEDAQNALRNFKLGNKTTAGDYAALSGAAGFGAGVANAPATFLTGEKKTGLAADSGKDLDATGTLGYKAGKWLQGMADELQKVSEDAYRKGVEGLNPYQKTLYDLGVNAVQMAGDMGVAALTGGSALVPMGVRVFGNAAQEARKAGADQTRQIFYGAAVAGVEMLTERMFDGLAGIYGAGGADKMVEQISHQLARTPAGRAVIQYTAGSVGEGLEEVISGLASPYLQRIYTDEPEKNTVAGLAYEFLIGGLMGAIGGAVKVPTNLRAEKGIVKAAEDYFEAREQYGPTAEETQKKLIAYNQAAGLAMETAAEKGVLKDKAYTNKKAAPKAQQEETQNNNTPLSGATRQLSPSRGEPLDAERGEALQGEARQEETQNRAETAREAKRDEAVRAGLTLLFGDKDSVSVDDMNAFAESHENGPELLARIVTEANRQGLIQANGNGSFTRTVQTERSTENDTRPAGYYGGENDTTDARTVRLLGNLAKAANIRIERGAIGENENGYYINGKAVLAEDAGVEVAKHEVTHHIKQYAPKEYREFEDYVVKLIKEDIGEDGFEERVKLYQSEYAKNGNKLTRAETIEEITADFAWDMRTDEEKIARFAGEKPTLAKRIIEAIRDFIRRLTNAGANTEDTAELRRAEALWEKALKKAGQNTETVESGKVRYSTKKDALALEGVDWMDDKSSIKDQLTKHADEINKMQPVAVVEYSKTTAKEASKIISDAVKSIGGERMIRGEVSFAFDGKGISSILSHAKGDSLLAAAIASPYVAKYGKVIAGQKNHKGEGTTTLTYAAPVEINGAIVNVGVAIQFASDGRSHAVNVETQGSKAFRVDMEKAPAGIGSRVYRYGKGTALPTADASASSITEVTQNSKKKYSLKIDSEGRKLSETQQEYFKDSKVRDEDGKLKVMYHGTNAKFTVFNRGQTNGWLGKGIYFAENKAYAKENGRRINAVYLDAKNPYISSASDGFDFLGELKQKFPETDSYNIAEILEKHGYDGVILKHWDKGTIATVFNPNQIKLIDNTSPTESDDIRYSRKGVKEAAEEAEALKKENEILREQNQQLESMNEYYAKERKSRGAREIDDSAVWKLSGEMLKEYGSSMKRGELKAKLKDVYDRLEKNQIDGKTWNEETRAIAQEIAENVLTQSNPLYNDMQELYRQIKGKRLKISENERGDVTQSGLDYNSFRKKYFGSIYLADNGQDVDSFYSELSDQYPGWFPREIYSQGEQLAKIAETFDKLRPVQAQAYSGEEMRNEIDIIANRIREKFYDMPEIRKLLAEKKYERQKEKDKAYMKDRLEKQREKFDNSLKEIKREVEEDREERKERDRRKSIMREAERLSKRLLRPTDTAHIPQEFRGAVLNLLEYINMESQYEWKEQPDGTYKRVKAGMGDKATARTERARALREELEALEKSGSFSIDPELNDRLKELAGYADIKLDNMTREQLDTVWNVMQAVRHAISTADTMFGNSKYRKVSDAVYKLKADNEKRKDAAQYTGKLQRGVDFFSLDNAAPETFFHRMGEAGDDLFRQLTEAADKQTTILKDAADYAQNAIKDSGFDIGKLEEETHEFTLESGAKLTLSTAQIMELFELMKREQAEAHIRLGGLRPDKIKAKNGKAIAASKAEKVTDGDLAKILGVLTPEQKALVNKLQKYMSGKLAESGNEASMRVYGYQKFNEPNYWPIRVNKGEVASDPAKEAGSKTIPGFGMTKAVIPQSSNGIMLGSFFNTYLDHVTQMATYAGYLEANENATKFLNYRFLDENGNATGETTKTLMTKIYGEGGQAYFEKLLHNIAQGTKAGRDSSPMEAVIGNTKAAMVGANLRVILQQPTAILRAADEIDLKYMAKGMEKSWKTGWNRALQYAPIAQWKDWGYFEMDTGRSLRNVVLGDESKIEKARNASMAAAGAADSIAWGKLWNAVEAEVKDKQPGLTGEAFTDACKQRFNEVIYRTQVVDSVLNRTQIMRKGGIDKLATSFMSEPLKVYNMVERNINDMIDARQRGDKKALYAAKMKWARTIPTLTVSFIVNAAAQAIMDAARNEDKNRRYMEKFGKYWLTNSLESILNPAQYIPYLRDLYSIWRGFDVSRMDMDALSDLVNSSKKLGKAISGKGKKSIVNAGIDEVLQLLKLPGIPAYNIRRDVRAIAQTIMNEVGLWKEWYELDKIMLKEENDKGSFYEDLWTAFNRDYEDYKYIYRDMLESGFNEKQIRSSMQDEMKKALGVNHVDELPIKWDDIKGSEAGAEKWRKIVENQ